MTRYEHVGNAKETTLTAELSSAGLLISIADGDGWPVGTIGLFWVVINQGLLIEEKILCASRSDKTIQVFSDVGGNGRGRDDTVAQTHPVNSVIKHVWTATEADEANAHMNVDEGAHGYPPKATLVTLAGAQVLSDKTLDEPIIDTPAVSGGTFAAPAITGGSVTDAAKVTLAGVQTPAEFRAREIMLSTADPTPADGEDGAVWIKYV